MTFINQTNNNNYALLSLLSSLLLALLTFSAFAEVRSAKVQKVYFTDSAPKIDGIIDAAWSKHPWKPMDQHILGEIPTAEDFSGKFKLMWDNNYLYLLAEIQDDILADHYPNPFDNYWNDDCLEIFLDPDGSGGNHLNSHNAYAYHVALDNQSVDYGDKPGDIILLNEHVTNQWRRGSTPPYYINWEARIAMYSEKWSTLGEKSRIKPNKDDIFGFMLAYCDADGTGQREHFMGSQAITPNADGDKNLGYITADVFTKMQFSSSPNK